MKLVIPSGVVESAILAHLKNIGFVIPLTAKITTPDVEISIAMQNTYVKATIPQVEWIQTIKSLRQATGMGLKDSKDMVDASRQTGSIGPLTYDHAILFAKFLSENGVTKDARIVAP